MSSAAPDEHDSDENVEFEDVPLPHANQAHYSFSIPADPPLNPWSPVLSLPEQRDRPIPSGSEEETQLRGRLSVGIERITHRQMKSDFGMDAPDTRASLRRYGSFKELADEVEHLVDLLWASATPSIQVESLITLAGIIQMSLRSFEFEPHTTLSILHKFDEVFAALFTGMHPLTHLPLPGAESDRPRVTQTQKVRIRSLAETTRYKVFSMLPGPDEETTQDTNEDDFGDGMRPWMLEATRIYDKTLMLLADQGNTDEQEEVPFLA